MARHFKAQTRRIAVEFLVFGACVWGPSYTAWSEPMPASVRVCRSQVDEAQRLRCYDSAVDAAAPATASPVLPRGATAAAEARRPDPPAATTSLPAFSARIAALDHRPSGAVNVTLDNGQVWAQFGPGGKVPLQTGDSVTIRPGLFGASVLVGPTGWITKVHSIAAPGATSQ